VICQNCHEENIDVAVSCHKCGKRMAASGQGAVSNKKICVQCGSELNDDDCFCMQCGAAAEPSAGAGDETGAALEQENESHDAQISANIPFVTWLITALIIACSGWVFWRTSSLMDVSAEALLKFGGNFEALTSSGEEWRLWSSTFLHGGLMHLAMNIACLLSFGPLLERMAGHVKFLSLYLVAAIGASAISMKFNGDVVSIGASGAIFGIFASLMIYVLVMGRRFGLTGDSIWAYLKEGFIFVGVNLAYSLRPGIDMSAHLGGLLVGAVAGLLIAIVDCVKIKGFSRIFNCVLAVFCAIVITAMTYSWIKSDSWIGSESENHTLEYKLNSSAAEEGDAVAQFNLGLNYYKGQGVEQNYTEAAKYFRKAAEQGHATAQCYLGLMYGNGRGVEKDEYEAVKWYRKSAEQGFAGAQKNLGVMYMNGQGVEQDYAEAVKWYRKAAEQGDAGAQRNLGLMYDNGRGVEQDYAEAVKWYRKAAEQGDALAQCILGIMYMNGQGVEQDYAEAVKWYRKAAEQGNAQGQLMLGIAYVEGVGVEQNRTEGVKWLRRAAAQEDENIKAMVKAALRELGIFL
jgi:TPR repeat protein/membrane associated rhomboid family serine protease